MPSWFLRCAAIVLALAGIIATACAAAEPPQTKQQFKIAAIVLVAMSIGAAALLSKEGQSRKP